MGTMPEGAALFATTFTLAGSVATYCPAEVERLTPFSWPSHRLWLCASKSSAWKLPRFLCARLLAGRLAPALADPKSGVRPAHQRLPASPSSAVPPHTSL